MEAPHAKYRPTEILQIIQANYKQQQQLDDLVLSGQELDFNTTILEWRDICDLVDTDDLWKYLNFYFRLDVDKDSWLTQLEPEDEKTIGDLCEFISLHARKEIIRPVKLLGNHCQTAAIFKVLAAKLKDRGVNVSEFRPSSKLEPLFQKYGSAFIEEVNLLNPTVLPTIDYKTNWVHKWGLRLLLIFFFATFFFIYKESELAWWAGATSLTGFIMTWIGSILKPARAKFENIETVANLVRRMNAASI